VLCLTSCQHGRQPHSSLLGQTVNDPGVSHERWLFESKFAGVTYEYAVSEELLHRTSRWRAENDPLPFTPNQAEKVATEEARRLRPDVASWMTEDMVLRRVSDECWYYEVLLLRADQVIIGLPPSDFFLKVPVLTSGTAVQPLPKH
jgi:hypothetical protein